MIDANLRDEAALWMARSRDPLFSDWDALSDWLEADPVRNLAYEAAFAAHDLAGELAAPEPPAEAVKPRRGMRWMAAGVGGVSAAAAAVVALLVPSAGPLLFVAETKPGQIRMVTLGDGTRIALNGGSRLVLSSGEGRTARLERGEAMFSVVHDDNRPFTVDVGGERLVDLGTRFNVVRRPHGSEVAVAQGAVLYDPEGAAVRLGPGRMLRKNDHSRLVEVSDVNVVDVGGWRTGRLVYRGAPLSRVADDLGRLTGQSMKVAPELSQREFTGVIVVPGSNRPQFLKRLGLILDVEVASGAKGYYLTQRAAR